MISNKRIELYIKASEKWGTNSQIIVAIEEMNELCVQLAKVLNNKHNGEYYKLIDELADARIMIEQVELIFGIYPNVEQRMDEKLNRLEGIISGAVEHPHK